MKDLTVGKPWKLIIAFALPIAIGNIFQLCYSFADFKIVGSTLGENALAAVSSTTTLNDLIVGFLIGLTNGFSVITAQRFGAKDERGLKKSVALSIMLGLVMSAVLTLLSVAFLDVILRLLNVPQSNIVEAAKYVRIILLGMTASMVYNICSSLLRAIGDTVTPLIFLIVSTVLNVGLDYAFIVFWGFGVDGAAYATVISQAFSAVLCVIYMYVRYPILHIGIKDFTPDKSLISSLMSSGLSMGLMQSLVAFGTVALQSSINSFGDSIIIAHTSARKLTSFFMMPFGVLGMTMAAYCAQNYGAEKYSRIRKGVFTSVMISWGWCLVLFTAIFTVVPSWLRFVASTDNPEIIDTGSLYLRVNCILYFVTAVISVFRNSLQGIGEHRTPIFSSALELLGKVAVVIFLAPRIGYWGIIVSEPIVWVIMVIPLIIKLMRHPVMRKNITEAEKNAG